MVIYFQVTNTDNFQVLGKKLKHIYGQYTKKKRLISLTWKGIFVFRRFDDTSEVHTRVTRNLRFL